ncbi:hypothetical protein AKUG0101_12750 [Apilactobacillus kunkeei]|nr:hypothetical protein AKUG0101_12750 [Apilactobacillus kunkeei]
MKKIINRLTAKNILMLVISFVCMFFLTTASPFYAFNKSVDANTMYTVGKGLLHGLLPYKDLFDNRGAINLLNSFRKCDLFIQLFYIYLCN